MSFLPSQYRTVAVPFNQVMISGNGSPRDCMTVQIPTSVTNWVPHRPITAIAFCQATGGSISVGAIDIYTNTGALGTSLLGGSTTLTNMTTTGQIQNFSGLSIDSVLTATGLTIRQLGNTAGGTGSIWLSVFLDTLG